MQKNEIYFPEKKRQTEMESFAFGITDSIADANLNTAKNTSTLSTFILQAFPIQASCGYN